MTVRFKRLCQPNYYGVRCSTYCIETDSDSAGHYMCNPIDGSKICLPGYNNLENNCQESKSQPLSFIVMGVDSLSGVAKY